MICEHAHVLEPHAMLIQQIQGCLILFVYFVQHIVTVCIYIFIMCMLQSIHMHATLIEYTEARGPIYEWHLCRYNNTNQPRPRWKTSSAI